MIQFACPKCHSPLSAQPTAAGKAGACNRCGSPVTVPAETPPPPVPTPEPPESTTPSTRANVKAVFWLVLLVVASVLLFVVLVNASAGFGIRPTIERIHDLLFAGFLVVAAYVIVRTIDRLF